MIRIRKIVNPLLEANRRRIEEVKEGIKNQFSTLSEEKASEFIEQLLDSLKFQSLTSLFVAEDINNNLKGFAVLMYMPDINFCFLDYIAVTPSISSSGIGGALYERLREEAITLRQKVYLKKFERIQHPKKNNQEKISIYINEKHSIHHIKERGYVESPVRINSIKKELLNTNFFIETSPEIYPEKFILSVHDKRYFTYFKNVCNNLPAGKSIYPYVFPVRNAVKASKDLSVRAGYFCFDTFTPHNNNAFLAAKGGVDCALSAADALISGKSVAYVLTRPPGHHAEKALFGGFCYFNNCAIAAERLSSIGKVAILDIDFHHGNGQQQIFYERNDVLTISAHGHPSFAYPYFSGFEEEKAENKGMGFNYNFPLPETISYELYEKTIKKCIHLIKKFNPQFFIVALGLDTAKNDPTGTWNFTYGDIFNICKLLGSIIHPIIGNRDLQNWKRISRKGAKKV